MLGNKQLLYDNVSLGQENRRLTERVRQLEQERNALLGNIAGLQQELARAYMSLGAIASRLYPRFERSEMLESPHEKR